MNFAPGEDLATFLVFVERLAAAHRDDWVPGSDRQAFDSRLEQALADSGFLGAALEPGLGLPAACLLVSELAGLPGCTEVAASALIGPFACPALRGPLAVIWGDPLRPTRFLPQARAVLHVQGEQLRLAPLSASDVQALESLYAYPMGVLRDPAALGWEPVLTVGAARVHDLGRLATAAEIVGCLRAALASVVAHVSERRQFGRPLGSFQTVQHRLAGAASQVEGAHWLLMRAAWSDAPVDIAAALAQAQSMCTRVGYDLHQFMGAMGLTLEHQLHRWTYRLRLLRTEFGGAEAAFSALAGRAWPDT